MSFKHGIKLAVTSGWVSIILLVGSSLGHAESMKQAVQVALDTHPEVLAAKMQRRARQHEVYQAQAGHMPEVYLTAGVGNETTKSPGTGNNEVDLTRQELAINASLNVFDGFGTTNEVARQRAREQSSGFSVDVAAENIALSAAEAYTDVLRHKSLLDLSNQTLTEHKKIHKQMKSRNDSGFGSQADLDQIAGRLALAQTNVVTTENNLLDVQSVYQRVVGTYPDIETMLYPTNLSVQLPETQQQAIDLAVERNPALKASQSDVDAAIAQYDAAKSPFYPRLYIDAYKTLDEDIGGVVGEDETSLVALRMRYDLFAGGRNIERKRSSAYKMTEAQELRNDTRRKVVQTMRVGWNAYESVRRQLPYLKEHVRASEDTKKAYAQQFNIGRRTLLDLLNTENEEADAKRALVNANHDLVLTQLQVLHSTGSLIEGMQLIEEAEPKIESAIKILNYSSLGVGEE